MNEGALSGVLGLRGWPAVAEEAIIARDVLLAAHVGSRLHVCHVSTAGSVEIIRWAKAQGLDVTAEVTPHHLLLTDELVDAATTRSTRSTRRCARRRTSTALRDGARRRHDRRGRHRPRAAPVEDKDCEWAAAAFGMLGLETALSVVQEAMVDTGLLDWAGVADRMSVAPGRGSAGSPATAGRSRSARRPTSCSSTRPRAASSTRRDSAVAVAQHPVRRARAARPRRRHVPARRRARRVARTAHSVRQRARAR